MVDGAGRCPPRHGEHVALALDRDAGRGPGRRDGPVVVLRGTVLCGAGLGGPGLDPDGRGRPGDGALRRRRRWAPVVTDPSGATTAVAVPCGSSTYRRPSSPGTGPARAGRELGAAPRCAPGVERPEPAAVLVEDGDRVPGGDGRGPAARAEVDDGGRAAARVGEHERVAVGHDDGQAARDLGRADQDRAGLLTEEQMSPRAIGFDEPCARSASVPAAGSSQAGRPATTVSAPAAPGAVRAVQSSVTAPPRRAHTSPVSGRCTQTLPSAPRTGAPTGPPTSTDVRGSPSRTMVPAWG